MPSQGSFYEPGRTEEDTGRGDGSVTRDWSDVPNSNVATVFPRSNMPRCACQEPLPGKCCGRDGHGVGHGQLPRYLPMSDCFPRCANGIRFCKEPLFGSVGALRGLRAVFHDFLLLPLVPGSRPSSGAQSFLCSTFSAKRGVSNCAGCAHLVTVTQ